ncbi:MAG: flagellar biosynthetic protein FliR [bacterium]|nr:flagellar biosynthetic protein FliR [bacterium]
MDQIVSQIFRLLEVDISQKNIIIFLLIVIRMIMIVNLVPFLGSKNAPSQIKICFSLLFALLLWPGVINGIPSSFNFSVMEIILLFFKEIFIGFTIGFVSSQIFYTVEMCGQLIDVTRGVNQVQLMVPELGERSSGFGTFYYQLMLVLFLASNLHSIFFHSLVKSFIDLPVQSFPHMSRGPAAFFDFTGHILSEIFMIAVALALPIAAVCLIIDIGFGLINRIAPQINAYFMSLPTKALGGVIIAFAALFMTVKQFNHYTKDLLEMLFKTIELLR